jgi:hypothetical protein
MFGYSTPVLQKLAMQLVSQGASAIVCEQDRSTFAFIHTKVHNRLTYEKLHKLVYVNYNLKIQNSIDGGSPYHDEDDPFNRLMEFTLVDVSNLFREWMEHARSMVQPKLDEESPKTHAPISSSMVTATADPRDLQHRTGSHPISQWARKNIGDSHKGKRKTYATRPKKSTREKGRSVRSDATTEDENSPTYQESNDSSSRTYSHDGNDGDDTSGGPPHLPHKEDVMSDLSLPSQSTSSHTAPRMRTTASRHCQEF